MNTPQVRPRTQPMTSDEKRCETCEYWVADKQIGYGQCVNPDSDYYPDNNPGRVVVCRFFDTCPRHTPRRETKDGIMPTTDIVERLRTQTFTGDLEAIRIAADLLEKLPVDAEGNRVPPGETVYYIKDITGVRLDPTPRPKRYEIGEFVLGFDRGGGPRFWWHPEAAEAALREQQERENG